MTEQPARGLTEGEAARLLARTGAIRPDDEPLVREHRPRQRLHGLQPHPRRRRRCDARVRRVAGRALPRRARLELGDRDHAGDPREARARPARRARRADGDRRSRRGRANGCRRPGRRRATCCASSRETRSSPTASWRRADGVDARRVDPHGRVAAGPPRAGDAACAPARSSSRARASSSSRRSGRRAMRRGSPERRARSGILARRSSARSTGCC